MGIAKQSYIARNYKESYDYYTRAIEADPKSSEAWLGKGFSVGRMALIADLRLGEMIHCLQRGISLIAGKIDISIKRMIIKEAQDILIEDCLLSKQWAIDNIKVSGCYIKHVQRTLSVIETLNKMSEWDQSNVDLLSGMVLQYSALILGLQYPTGVTIAESILSADMASNLQKQAFTLVNRIKALNSSYIAPDLTTHQEKRREDPLIEEAIKLLRSNSSVSPSLFQRKFVIGYTRAIGLVEVLEEKGYLSKPGISGQRDVLKR